MKWPVFGRSRHITERRTDHATRKRVSEMSPEEMREALLVSEKTGLPNKRAFDEREPSSWVAMCDLNGLKALNDGFGYSAGDIQKSSRAQRLLQEEPFAVCGMDGRITSVTGAEQTFALVSGRT